MLLHIDPLLLRVTGNRRCSVRSWFMEIFGIIFNVQLLVKRLQVDSKSVTRQCSEMGASWRARESFQGVLVGGK